MIIQVGEKHDAVMKTITTRRLAMMRVHGDEERRKMS
jgi:hypothetical protein